VRVIASGLRQGDQGLRVASPAPQVGLETFHQALCLKQCDNAGIGHRGALGAGVSCRLGQFGNGIGMQPPRDHAPEGVRQAQGALDEVVNRVMRNRAFLGHGIVQHGAIGPVDADPVRALALGDLDPHFVSLALLPATV